MTGREKLIELLKLPSNCMPHAKCESCGLNGGCSVQRQADKIIDDGWIRPPRKVGDTVYYITGIYNTLVKSAKVEEIYYGEGGFAFHLCSDYTYFTVQSNEIYFTKEEAEQALKGEKV